ncbi:60S ribosome biogenesis protein Rrp14 [Fonsecaea pedrosoi]|nr:60S ribosome biogenesis protein Rrp14 [Fonsecaea pedrosoi]
MADELAERLKSHARSFDSLLSLIPAKLYYGEDVSDQWKRKKQTPEQKRAAKMAKLDPDNWKSAKDIVDERAAAAAMKRKRDDEEDEPDENSNLVDGGQVEPPKAVQDAQAPKPKKQKTNSKDESGGKGREKTKEKRKKDKARQKLERQKAKKKEAQQPQDPQKEALKKEVKKELNLQIPVDLQVSTQRKSSPDAESPSTASSEEEPEEVFSPQHESGTSSTSSIQPASIDETVKHVHSSSLPPASAQAINNHDDDTTTKTPRERLQEALSQFRAERKADGGDGRPPKNRQELLEQRRRKEEAKKAAKKEQKRREKEEEARRQDEEIARHFSPGGSGSLLASPRSPMIGDNGGSSPNSNSANNFTFGRITFEDGTHLEPSSTAVVEEHKKKGVRDTATELKLAEAKKARLAGLDEQKRREIEQKDMWLNAKRRAHGEHVRDNTSLLKKALKRQQGQKKKSEREWNDRLEGVKKAQDAKQKKRVENLAKRKDEKGQKKTKVRRPGFEGSFKGRTGGKRKS